MSDFQRKYTWTLGELIDRMAVVSLKYAYNKDLRDQYSKELEDIMHDVDWYLTNRVGKDKIDAKFIKLAMFSAQYNTMIWENESGARGDGNGDNLPKTHSLNGVRCRAKDLISVYSKERIDPKIDALGADISEWEPIW